MESFRFCVDRNGETEVLQIDAEDVVAARVAAKKQIVDKLKPLIENIQYAVLRSDNNNVYDGTFLVKDLDVPDAPYSIGEEVLFVDVDGRITSDRVCDLLYATREGKWVTETIGHGRVSEGVFTKDEAYKVADRRRLEKTMVDYLFKRQYLCANFVYRDENAPWCVYGGKKEFAEILRFYMKAMETQYINSWLNAHYGKRTKSNGGS